MAPTTPALTAAEEAVAADAVQAVLVADIPGWQRAMIPQATLAKAINAAVAAIDALRDRVPQSMGGGNAPKP